MAPRANLREIGLEGFALIDKLYGGPTAPRTRRPNTNGLLVPARQGRWVVQVPNDEMEELALNSNEYTHTCVRRKQLGARPAKYYS
ncbi:hypothetical protein E2542_SST18580 [Spatholobus suberectus]|nr:hypothetical protein E2542_SST18580 [Spatholobus suberectus]